jgi:DNA polymerase-4
MGNRFFGSDYVQYALFGDNLRKDNLRKVVYSIKDHFGFEKIQLAGELTATPVMKDVIGFRLYKRHDSRTGKTKANS